MSKKLYINIWDYKDREYPFQIFIGGRGCGKTYSMLHGALTGECGKFVLMRRTAQELELMCDSERNGEGANPFKPINKALGTNYGLKPIIKNLVGVFNREVDENGKFVYPMGAEHYALALSTISSVRSLDFSDVDTILFDEFIAEKHVHKMKAEYEALMNAIETINRNREFDGRPPVNVIMCANSNDIYNPIFTGLGIVSEFEKMLKNGREHRYLKERGLALHYIHNNAEFMEKKSNTALYRLTAGTRFSDMALSNQFSYNDFSLIANRNIKGYQPICSIGDIYLYRKKGDSEIYCTYTKNRCPSFDVDTEQDRRRFMSRYGLALMPRFVAGTLIFESYDIKQRMLDLIL